MGALRCCTTFRQPCGIILERGLPLHSQLLNGGLMPQYMVLRPRGACCTTWHPGDMVQVAAFPLMSHNIQLSQGGPGDSLFSYLGDAESIASNGERRQEREHSVLFPYFVITGYTVSVRYKFCINCSPHTVHEDARAWKFPQGNASCGF